MLRLLIILIFSISIGCEGISDNPSNQFYFKGHLEDSIIRSTIVDYINENQVDKDKSYLMVRIRGSTGKELVYIENNTKAFSEYSEIPSFYELFDDYLVLYYSNLDFYLKKDKILNELRVLINDKNMELDSSLNFYHSKIWLIEKCKSNYKIYKGSWPKLKLRGIPCDYELLRDSINLDSIYIKKN